MASIENELKKELKEPHKIFVVDDHPIVRQGLTQLINQQNDMIVCGDAGDVSDAKTAISSLRPDATIIDISLGEVSGIRLIEDLSNRYPSMSILALSMHDESVYGERCLKAGAKGYIMKQESPESVISALRIVLSGNVYLSENMRSDFINKIFTNQNDSLDSPVSSLSNRELEVFQLFGQGLRTQQVADSLRLSIKTIETHVEHIKKKMHFRDLHELTTFAIRWTVGKHMA